MTDELVLYTHPMSRGRIVRWMLEEIGQPYRTEVIDYGPKMKSPEYLAINPMGKVPAVRHGKVVVTECAAICAYLADAFPTANLAPPPGDPARAPFYRWMFFAPGLSTAVTNKTLGFQVPKERMGMVGWGTMDDVLTALESAVAGREYIAGDRFSAADVYVGSHLMWGMQFGTLEKRKAFEDYVARLVTRPAAKRANTLDDALVPAHPVPGMPASKP